MAEELDIDAETARKRLGALNAEFASGSMGWKAKLGGSIVESRDGVVEVKGDPDRIRNLVCDGGSITLNFDGASRGNPGRGAAAYVLSDAHGVVLRDGVELGTVTNNEAEYMALIHGLLRSHDLGFNVVESRGDSELVVRQVRGEWRCRADNLKPLLEEVQGLVSGFSEFSIEHVPREMNTDADDIVNELLDE